ncbi:polynucleotide kinase [Vibrio phage RYC]|nr:polynucleotide kinase [Vibrio phage RYC]
MAHMTIKSSNPNLSYVLCKNPASGLMNRKIRQGFGFGWYGFNDDLTTNEQEYHMLYREDFDCDSFGQSGFSYLSKEQYVNAFAYNSLMTTLLRDVLKGASEHDTVCEQEVVLHQVGFKGVRLLEQLQQYLPVKMQFEEIRKFVFKITFSGTCTLHEIITCITLACMYLAGDTSARLTKLDEAFMVKYARMINDLDLPFFLRYVFARNFFRDANTYKKHVEKLNTESIKLAHGDTAMQRFRFIEKQLDMTVPILDVGCGEGLYALNLSKRTPFTYHAVDIDTELTDMVFRKGRARGLDIKTYNHIDEYQEDQLVDIVFTEVIEHMPEKEASEFFSDLLTKNFRKLIITTPDKNFNPNYGIKEGEFRHDDHDWEMNKEQFEDWVCDHIAKHEVIHGQKFDIQWVGMGDCVDGIFTSQGFIITNTDVRPQAIITVGCSASGKSTFANRLAKLGWTEINRDTIRFRGGEKNWLEYNWKQEGAVQRKWEKKLHNACSNSENIVVSDTNLDRSRAEELEQYLIGEGYDVTFRLFEEDFAELLKRDSHRQGGVGYEVLLKQYQRFMVEWKGVQPYVPNGSQQRAYIFDLDGTLFTNDTRNIYDETRVKEDSPIHRNMIIARSLINEGIKVIFLSGRKGTEQCLKDSRESLVGYLGEGAYDCPMFFREPEDNSKDSICKLKLFDKYVRNNYHVLTVFDDRQQVIEECWNVIGIPVTNVGNPFKRF